MAKKNKAVNKKALMTLAVAVLAGCSSPSRVGVIAQGPHEYMYVAGDGQKAWYSALELEKTARRYADEHKLEFNFEGTEKNVWVNTDGGRVLADVYYSSGLGEPSLSIAIDRYGRVIRHRIGMSICGNVAKTH